MCSAVAERIRRFGNSKVPIFFGSNRMDTAVSPCIAYGKGATHPLALRKYIIRGDAAAKYPSEVVSGYLRIEDVVEQHPALQVSHIDAAIDCGASYRGEII